jgi:FAD dependent oxidoreductase
MCAKIAVAGAGIYGATIAIRLAEEGHSVDLFDPLGVLRAASAINQHRVHAGYHYPRSTETIAEILEARSEFQNQFQPAIVARCASYYAIPHEGSRTSPEIYEEVMARHGLKLTPCRPDWINFSYIDRCYAVEEGIYDSDILRGMLEKQIKSLNIRFHKSLFLQERRPSFDYVIWAVYGLGPSRGVFKAAKYQVAEKVLIQLPTKLQSIACVVVDGPFTAFDLYGNSQYSLFGSAKHTNHWSSSDAAAVVPQQYQDVLNYPSYVPTPFTRFETMRLDCSLAIPAAADAVYVGSRFTMRVVEDEPGSDRRILHLVEPEPGEFHVFSGKVVSSLKAARLISQRIGGQDGLP